MYNDFESESIVFKELDLFLSFHYKFFNLFKYIFDKKNFF